MPALTCAQSVCKIAACLARNPLFYSKVRSHAISALGGVRFKLMWRREIRPRPSHWKNVANPVVGAAWHISLNRTH